MVKGLRRFSPRRSRGKKEKDPFASLFSLARKQGYLTYDDLNNLLPPGPVDLESLDALYEKLLEEGVEIRESPKPVDPPEPAQEETPSREGSPGYLDALAFYLHQLSRYDLLSPEEERRLTLELKRIREEIALLLLKVPEGRKRIIHLVETCLKDRGVLGQRFTFTRVFYSQVVEELSEILALLKRNPFTRGKGKDPREPLNSLVQRIRALPWVEDPFLSVAGELLHAKASLFSFPWRRRLQRLWEKRKEYRDALAMGNLRLVISIARKYRSFGVAFNDLIQEGNMGLLRAIEKFDPDLEFRFSTYAIWWIRQAILRMLLEKSSLVHVPLRRRSDPSGSKEAIPFPPGPEPLEGLPQEGQRSPEGNGRVYHLDHPIEEDSATSFLELLHDQDAPSPLEQILEKEEMERIQGIMRELLPEERRVIELRYGLHGGRPCTLEEAGKAMGYTRERIRQLEKQALRHIRLILMERSWFTLGEP